MRVNEVANGMLVEPNRHVIPLHNTTMSISHLTLQLVPRDDSAGMRDAHRGPLHEVLSQRWGIAPLALSSPARDRTGHWDFAKFRRKAAWASLEIRQRKYQQHAPKSRVHAGYTDYVLSPKEIARELARLARGRVVPRSDWRPGGEGSSGPAARLGRNFFDYAEK